MWMIASLGVCMDIKRKRAVFEAFNTLPHSDTWQNEEKKDRIVALIKHFNTNLTNLSQNGALSDKVSLKKWQKGKGKVTKRKENEKYSKVRRNKY